MRLSIYTIKKTLFEGDVESISMPTRLGEITVLDHHIPLVSVLSQGNIHIVTNTKESQSFPLINGFLEIQNDNSIKLLIAQ